MISYALIRALRCALFCCALFVCASGVVEICAQTDSSDEPVAASEDYVKLFEQGQDAHARGDLQKAVSLYEATLKVNPKLAEAEYQRGVALVDLKRFPDAEQAFRRAIELREEWALPRVALAKLLASDLRLEPKLKEKIQAIEYALTLDKNNLLLLTALAQAHSLTGNQAEAVRLLREATSHQAATADVWLQRAAAERAAGNAAEAATSFERALALGSNNFSARLERVGLLLEKSASAEANKSDLANVAAELRTLDEALTSQPTSATKDEVRRLANFHARAGERLRLVDAAQSLAHFRRALELEPTNADYATGYAAALVQVKRFAEAESILRRVIAAAPDNYAAHANLATALNELKRYDAALIEYQWLRKARPELAITDFFVAQAHDHLQQYPEALAAYEAFIARADPNVFNLEIEKVKLRLPVLRNQVKKHGRR